MQTTLLWLFDLLRTSERSLLTTWAIFNKTEERGYLRKINNSSLFDFKRLNDWTDSRRLCFGVYVYILLKIFGGKKKKEEKLAYYLMVNNLNVND